MSVLGYFARNSFIRLLSFVTALAAAFMVTPHMLLCLGDATYGLWAMISSLAGYFLLLDLGLLQAVCRYAPAARVRNDAAARESVYATAFAVNILAGAITLAIATALALCAEFVFGTSFPPSAETALFIFLFSVAAQLVFRSSHALLAADMRWRDLALLAMLRTVFTACAVLGLLDATLPVTVNLVRVAAIMALGNILECLGHFFLAALGDSDGSPPRETAPNQPQTNAVAANGTAPHARARDMARQIRHRLAALRGAASRERAREMLRYGLPVLAANLGELLKQRSQIFMVGAFLGLAPTAIFSLAQQLMTYIGHVMLNAFGIMAPYFSRLHAGGDMAGCRRSLLESMVLSYSSSTYFGLCAVFYGGLFITRWLGPQYEQIENLLPLLGPAAIISFGGLVVSGFLLGLGEHRILATLNMGEGMLCLLLGIPAAAFFDLEGVAASILLCAAVTQLGILPRWACRAAGISPALYYAALLGSVAVQSGLQYGYYFMIRDFLAADYGSLALACAGQAVVAVLPLAAAVFLTNAPFRRKMFWRVADTAFAGQAPGKSASAAQGNSLDARGASAARSGGKAAKGEKIC